MTVVELLTKARALIEENWCQNTGMKTLDDGSTAFCASEAIHYFVPASENFHFYCWPTAAGRAKFINELQADIDAIHNDVYVGYSNAAAVLAEMGCSAAEAVHQWEIREAAHAALANAIVGKDQWQTGPGTDVMAKPRAVDLIAETNDISEKSDMLTFFDVAIANQQGAEA